jgi:hypothetical protein
MVTPRAYPGTAVLEEIQQRVLWLATRIVDAANHDRDTGDGVKVGGHQASSASLVTAMTALYFAHLDARLELPNLTTPRPEGRGFRRSPAGVPVSQQTARGLPRRV